MSVLQSILFLCHRVPYPPIKGDKIRSYNILKFLSQHYHVHLGAFVDDPNDFRYEKILADMCASHCLLPLNPKVGKLRSLRGFLYGLPLSLPYYANRKMQHWVDSILFEKQITGALVFSSTMAQYIAGERYSNIKRYIDFIDMDSDKWAQYSKTASPGMALVYGYEARMLFEWEKKIAYEFDFGFFVSEEEAELFNKKVQNVSHKISYFNNGVDTEYFSPELAFTSPYPKSCNVIVFTGVMNYRANVDAVTWFSKNVFPAIREKVKNVRFYIVGAKPNKRVWSLASLPGIEVTGAVDDVRPYLAHASVAVAPLILSRGIQNKVLEAMAMALPTVTTPQGFEGVHATPGRELIVVDGVENWVSTLINLLLNHNSIGEAARRLVLTDQYRWQRCFTRLKHYLDTTGFTG